MSSNKPICVHLKIAIAGSEYILGSLCLNSSSREMVYRFHFPKDMPFEQLYINKEIKSPRLDHITWHKKVINLKLYRLGIYKPLYQKITMEEDFLPAIKKIKPILVESFCLNGSILHLIGDKHNLKWKRKKNDEALIASFKNIGNFSLLLFLIPTEWDLKNCSIAPFSLSDQSPLFFSFDQICSGLCRITGAFRNWDVLACISPYAADIFFEDKRLLNQRRLINCDSPASGVNVILQKIICLSLIQLLKKILFSRQNIESKKLK